jgi:hypothetical protein
VILTPVKPFALVKLPVIFVRPGLRSWPNRPQWGRGRLGPAAIRVATESGDSQPLIDALQHTSASLSYDDLAALVNELPQQSFNLAPLAADLTQRLTETLRQRALTEPDAYVPDLATALNNLSTRLADLGRREDALAAAEEAVSIRRQLGGA